MKPFWPVLLALLGGMVIPAALGSALADRGGDDVRKGQEERAQAFAKLERGMTPEQICARIGPPKRIARQLLYHRHLEQWIYEEPFPARLVLDCPRGKKPHLISGGGWRVAGGGR